MKKKVLYGVIMAFFSILAIGTLQSCKDDLSDFEKKYGFDQEQLKAQLNDLQNQLNNCRNNCQSERDKLWAAVNSNTAQIKNNETNIALLADQISKLATTDLLNQKIDALRNELNANIDAKALELDNKIGELNGLITRLDEKYGEKFTALEGKYDEMDKKVGALSATVEAQKVSLEEIIKTLGELNTKVEGLNTTVEGLSQKYEAILGDVQSLWEEIAGMGGIKDQIGMILNSVRDIDNRLDFLMQRFDQLITEIISQATDGPVFGNFSLPLGVQSKLLFDWYGYNDLEAFNFPSTASEYNYYDAAPVFTQADQERIGGITKETIAKGVLGDVKLGKLYMTINPIGHYFDNDAFSLETSSSKKFPAVLNVKKSDKELIFGYHRSVSEGNGFYEADVVVPAKNVEDAKVEIDENLKAAIKEALKDKSKRSAVELLKAVYMQLNNMLPSYAVRYDWSVMDEEGNPQPYSVLSSYDIAAATAKPLSYSFLYGKGTSKRLPTFGHIQNLIDKLIEKGGLHFDFEPINFDNIKIELPEIKIEANVSEPTATIDVNIGTVYVYDENGNLIGTANPTVTVTGVEDLSDQIYQSIVDAINDIRDSVGGWSADADKQINDSLRSELGKVAQQLNDMMESINGQLDDMVDNVLNELDPYFDRLNRLIDIYNKVARKINNMLADPNHYLQVAMFYNGGNGNMGLLSTKLTDPTVFNGTGKYVGLYASSYTAEIVAPAFKKYVAVSNVYNADFTQDADATSKVRALNSASQFFNEVMNGHTIRYSIPASKLEKGKIYEIVYQGVDYSGRTSTQKFYIKVK